MLIAIDRGAASVIPGEKLGQQSKAESGDCSIFFAGEKKQNARIDGVDSSITKKSAVLLRAEMQPTRVHWPTAMATMQARPGRSTSSVAWEDRKIHQQPRPLVPETLLSGRVQTRGTVCAWALLGTSLYVTCCQNSTLVSIGSPLSINKQFCSMILISSAGA